MEQQQSRQEELKELIEMNIKEFIEAARQHLFGLMPAPQPALIPIPVRQVR